MGASKFTEEQTRAAFLAKVNKNGARGCWLWTGALDSRGRGAIGRWNGRHAAHRVSWEMHNGPIKNGLWVLHKCDVRHCVNPEHLYIGAAKENSLDKAVRGRDPAAALNADQVRAIRIALAERSESGLQTKLAKEYDVTVGVINRIAVGRSYQWVE